MSTSKDIICERLHIQQRDHASKALLCKEIEAMAKDEEVLREFISRLVNEKRMLLIELYRVNWWNKLFKGLSKDERNKFKLEIRKNKKGNI